MQILDKNFAFLDEVDIAKREEIIDLLNTINTDILNKRNDTAMIYIRKALEIYFDHISVITKIDFSNCDSLNEKCSLIRNYIVNNSLDNNIISNINSIRTSGNSAAHESRMFLGCESISNLYKLWTVINYFKDFPFSLSNLKFDESLYVNEINKNNVDFNVITKNESSITNPVNRFIDVNKYNVYSWISEKNTKLIIPIYQRHYVWNKENIDVLLNDIENIKSNPENYEHFFGNISAKIIKADEKLKQIRIIYGQQRLTTSLIIASCIRDIIINSTRKSINNYDFLMSPNFENFIENPCKSFEENEFLRKILRPVNEKYSLVEKMSDIERHENTYNIAKNYHIIYDYLDDKYRCNVNELYDFLDIYLNKFQLSTISFNPDIYDNKKEMEIFESLNSKGTKLELHDLVKNFIFNLCQNELFDNDNTAQNLFNEYDSKTKNLSSKDLNKFYESLAEYELCESLPTSENIKFKKIKESILKLLIKWKIIDSNDEKINLSMSQYQSFMSKLGIYANVFASLTNNKKGIQNHFLHLYLKLTPVLEMMPTKMLPYLTSLSYLLIDILKYESPNICHQLSQQDINKIKSIYLDTLKYYLKCHVIVTQGDSNVRREIVFVFSSCINGKSGNLNNEKYNLSEKLDYIIDQERDVFTTDTMTYKYNDFANKLRTSISSPDVKKSLLMLVEYHMQNRFISDKNFDSSSPEFEHIMPENYELWIEEEAKQNPLMDKSKWIEEHTTHLNNLGNGLILAEKLNSKIQNKVFSIKQKDGYFGLTSKLYTNDLLTDIDVKNKTKWTFEDIEKRTEQLAQYIVNNVIKKNDSF